MKILLDENLPTKLKYDFGDNFEIHTVKTKGHGMAWKEKWRTFGIGYF